MPDNADLLFTEGDDLDTLHAKAEALATAFRYAKPAVSAARGSVKLARTDLFRARVVVVKKGMGENNLHYHTDSDSFWFVLKGKAKFYGPGDELKGEFGPNEGTTTPRYTRYWFENSGDDDLEMLHLFIMAKPGFENSTGRTDASPPKEYRQGQAEDFDAGKS